MPTAETKRPDWLRVRAPQGENYQRLKGLMRGLSLHTVCEEAGCPNLGECWESRTATFMILGDTCTRACRYCAVTSGRPLAVDWMEPRRVALAVRDMGLAFAVVTSVDRDDLDDGGAGLFAATIRKIRELVPGCGVEVLVPDFQGSLEALRTVMDARPDILNHNVETVPRLYRRARPKARYGQSLQLLRRAKDLVPTGRTKSGIMVGLGEEFEEVVEVLGDLRHHQVDIVTIGQYLRPSLKHLPIQRYWPPEDFARLQTVGRELGFQHVEAGPLVRSSYHARHQAESAHQPGASAAAEPG